MNRNFSGCPPPPSGYTFPFNFSVYTHLRAPVVISFRAARSPMGAISTCRLAERTCTALTDEPSIFYFFE
jgi:hypothetical protein